MGDCRVLGVGHLHGLSPPPAQWTEVSDQSGEAVWAPHQELLHPGLPAPRVSMRPLGTPQRHRQRTAGVNQASPSPEPVPNKTPGPRLCQGFPRPVSVINTSPQPDSLTRIIGAPGLMAQPPPVSLLERPPCCRDLFPGWWPGAKCPVQRLGKVQTRQRTARGEVKSPAVQHWACWASPPFRVLRSCAV